MQVHPGGASSAQTILGVKGGVWSSIGVALFKSAHIPPQPKGYQGTEFLMPVIFQRMIALPDKCVRIS